MKKKLISGILCVALVAASMAGCGKTAKVDTQKAEEANTSSGVFNEFGWEVPEDTLVINILDATGFDAPTEAEKKGRENVVKYFKDKLNVELKIQYTSGDGTEAVNLALASNQYPDIVTGITYDTMKKIVSMGKAVEMTPYMDTIGKDIKETMGDVYPLFLDSEAKLWYTPTLMGAITELPDKAAQLRYDEWQAIGAPEIKTPEDYYNALNEILKKNPTNPNGEKRYALSFYTDAGHWSDPAAFCGFWGLKNGYDIDEAGNFTYWAFTEEGKEMTKYFNRFYLDGTLDPDSFVNKYEQWKTKFSNERIAGVIGEWWVSYDSGHEVWQALDPNTPEDKRYIHVSFKDEDAEGVYLSGKNSLGSRYTVITDKAKNPEALMKFINFQATERGTALTNWGIPNGTPIGGTGKEGKFWNIDSEGKWEVDPAAKQALITETWSYDNEYYWTGAPRLFSSQSRWKDGIHCIWPNQMWYEENKWKSMMIKNMEGTIYDSSAMKLMEKTDEVKIAEQGVKDAWTMNWGAAVQANTEEEFEAAWAALQNALTTAGVDKLEQAMSENYKTNMEKMNK